MAFNFSEEKIVSKQLLKKYETICSTRITVDESEAVDKILDSFATVFITAEERVQENVQFGGKVELSVLFENRTKSLSSVNGVIDFVDKTAVAPAEWTFVYPVITTLRATKESENVIELTATIQANFYGIKKDAIIPVLPGNQGFFEKSRDISLSELACATSDSFSLNEDIEINEIVTKIVASYPIVSLNKVTAEENYVLVEGEVVREFVYLSGEHVRKFQKSYDFSQEISMLGAKKENSLDAMLKLQSYENNLDVYTEQNKSIIKSEVNIKANIFGFKEKQITLLADIFAPEKKVLLSTECVDNVRFSKQNFFSEKLEFVFDSSKLKRIDEVVFLSNIRAVVEQVNVVDQILNVSGQVYAEIVYKNYERDAFLSSEIVIPYNVQSREVDGVVSEVLVSSKCLGFKNKPGKEISINIELDFAANYNKQDFECFINSVEVENDDTKNENAITIYYPGEEQTAFDIAKELGISPEQLIAQNTELSEGKTPEKIVIYRQS